MRIAFVMIWGIVILKTNKSAARTIEILELLATSEKPLTQTEISKALDMPKTSTFELLYTLLEKGILEFENEEMKTFKLSIKTFEIGASVVRKINLRKVAHPLMEVLCKETRETVFIGIEDKGDIIYFDRVDYGDAFAATVGLGTRRPTYCTALGKSLLATYPVERLDKMFAQYPLEPKTAYTITDYDALLRELEKTKKRGYAVDDREIDNEIFCVAAPIYDWSDKAVAAISIASLCVRMNDERLLKFGELTGATAVEISKRLGFSRNQLYFTE